MWYLIYGIFLSIIICLSLALRRSENTKYYCISGIYVVLCIALQITYSLLHYKENAINLTLVSIIPAICQLIASMVYINIDNNKSIVSNVIPLSAFIFYTYMFVEIDSTFYTVVYIILSTLVVSLIRIKHEASIKKATIIMNSFSLIMGSFIFCLLTNMLCQALTPVITKLW